MDFDNRKYDPVKMNLRRLLSDTIEEVCLIDSNVSFLDFGENATTNLCMVIEAIFLHGLRNSLLNKARSLFFQDFNSGPTNLEFWSLVLIISHKEVIKQIEKLRFIKTDIGKCRVWVRISLGEKTLASYFKSLKSNSRVTSKYFSENAFLRDKNCVQIAENLITSVEKRKDFTFNLNSSLLNSWPSKTLTIVGIWNQAIKPTIEVATAIDIVNSIKDDEKIIENEVELESAISDYSYELSVSNVTTSTKNELFEKKCVKNADNSMPSISFHECKESDETLETVRDNYNDNYNQYENVNDTNNNSQEVIEKDDNQITDNKDNEEDKKLLQVHTNNDKSDDYTKLLDCYRCQTGTIQLRNYVEEIQSGLVSKSDLIIQLQDDIDDNLKKSLYKITKSCGLDNQNFECDKCRKQLICNYHLCYYTSKYYCNYCIDDQLYVLPAKILYNWDFSKYSISKDAAIFLKRIKNKPIFNCQTWNPLIYEKVQIMSKVLELRKQLVLIGAYLFTCRNITNAEDNEKSVPKHYVYTDVHLYSLKDFEQIFNGTYIKTCNKMLREHVYHVQKCYLCTQKGFICEICKKDHIIFPFDMQNTFLCCKCNALYHKTCYHSIEYCKKCKRKVKCDDNTVGINEL